MGIITGLFFDFFNPLSFGVGLRQLLILCAICCAIWCFMGCCGFFGHRRYGAFDEDP